jgi:3-deoxy-manno-octulosonate cytidylyltransferase (CMP-KDO synthetase)
MPAIVIIPARYASTRFPGKPLSLLSGRPMIQHVYERSKEARLVGEAFVATDSEEIYKTIESFGGKAVMTSEECKSGTDRIAEAVLKLQAAGYRLQDDDIVVNVQGDEPAIMPEMIDDVVGIMDDERASIGTLAKRIEEESEVSDPNIVKVVFDKDGFALYFSRSPVPYHRDGAGLLHGYFKHIGIYAYRKKVLLDFAKMPPTRLEETEKLEQLRAMENGLKIKVKETAFETIAVDTPADLERAAKMLAAEMTGGINA